MLVVLDPTPNPKLEELKMKFLAEGGEVYIGPDAWDHFNRLAGATMATIVLDTRAIGARSAWLYGSLS